MPRLSRIETLCKDNLPYGRLPTTEEYVAWVECPDDHPELNDYMLARPELVRYVRRMLDLTEGFK